MLQTQVLIRNGRTSPYIYRIRNLVFTKSALPTFSSCSAWVGSLSPEVLALFPITEQRGVHRECKLLILFKMYHFQGWYQDNYAYTYESSENGNIEMDETMENDELVDILKKLQETQQTGLKFKKRFFQAPTSWFANRMALPRKCGGLGRVYGDIVEKRNS